MLIKHYIETFSTATFRSLYAGKILVSRYICITIIIKVPQPFPHKLALYLTNLPTMWISMDFEKFRYLCFVRRIV